MMKILATIGPASDDQKSIEKFAAKTKLFRLNGSHNTIDWHKCTVKKIRSICPEAFILMDIPGVKPRTDNKNVLDIKAGQKVIFGRQKPGGSLLHVALTKELPSTNKENETQFSVNDGQYIFDFEESGDGYIAGQSRANFKLLPRKGINIPNSLYDEKRQLQIYADFIEAIYDCEIDALGLSFVQTGDLVDAVRKIVPNLVLVSKVENSEGLRNCRAIIDASDAVMIDRGDLAAEIGLEDLYGAVELIAVNTKSAGKPLIMATENLESMTDRAVPSKSEVISIAHSGDIGADCIMLSEETATAHNAVETLEWLSNFLKRVTSGNRFQAVQRKNAHFPELWKMLTHISGMPVLLLSKSGYALFDFLSVCPNSAVTIVTNSKKVKKIVQLYSNEITVIDEDLSSNIPIETLWNVVSRNKNSLFCANERIAAIYVSKYVKSARANSLTIFHATDFDTH